MTKTIQKALWAVIALVFLFILNGICGGAAFGAPANAASPVLEDLQRDENFNIDDYPEKLDDYSLQVIQIAESSDGELFIYVYQPAARAKLLPATSVNMSLNESADGMQLYKLTLLDNAGVFQKYRVKGVKVSSDEVRYYNITSIYRKFNNVADGIAGNDGSVDEIAYEVAQVWTVITDDYGNVNYSMTTPKVVTITDEYASFIRYTSGYWYLWGDATDAHYVAFTANYEIERLYEAELEFVQNYTYHHYASGSGRHTYSIDKRENKHVKLSDVDKGHVKITGLGGTRHSWERIQRVDDFLKAETLSTESKNKIKDKDWILRFTETSYTKNVDVLNSFNYDEYYYEITNVAILRLYFETDGQVYNVGVVSNKITEQNPYKDINYNNGRVDIFGLIITLTPIIVALLGVFAAIFPSFRNGLVAVLKAIGKGLLWLLKGLWWVICLSFRGIAALLRKRKKASPSKSSTAKASPSKSSKAKTSKSLKSKSRTSSRRSSARTGRKSYAGSKSK
ncbi:MAG: hypothetical protein NC311_12365 [Muribaculaceae bacterium]|nr:hypothetical protein [Muribaculaceae bacterium]